MESENMSFHIALDGAELDAGNNADAELLRHRRGFGDPGHGIVIGQRDRGEADALRLAHDVGWCT
jgi:hypothetical protein